MVGYMTFTRFEGLCNPASYEPVVGRSGEIARRWRRFDVRSFFMHLPPDMVARGLGFPTPNLQEFNFGFDEQALSLAVNLETLAIGNRLPFNLAATYTKFRSLYIGVISEQCLEAFSAPNLTDLVVYGQKARDYLCFVNCKGVDLSRLKKATIGWIHAHPGGGTVSGYSEGVRCFLMAAQNIETLVLLSKNIIDIVLKLLSGDYVALYQSRPLRLVFRDYEMELGRGGDRIPSVSRFREEVGCP
ncbi:hypothetical protein M408DRAFT_8207 [Serendipita vermifera MAFF 305830]|uniref:Uncharacterized protein n=1 Tax=Serendipita vermifera MAFF 305830 TaxID=933852 RepID=A0A0C3BBW5_SERVB|nr:hypothetical protein M408DRAFT_8207 [Serendipita vermifera MAFF 305830]